MNILYILFIKKRETKDDKTGKDNIGYLNYALVLGSLLQSQFSTPIVIGLYATWGTGKSFIMNKVKIYRKKCIYKLTFFFIIY